MQSVSACCIYSHHGASAGAAGASAVGTAVAASTATATAANLISQAALMSSRCCMAPSAGCWSRQSTSSLLCCATLTLTAEPLCRKCLRRRLCSSTGGTGLALAEQSRMS
eukprot:18927-Heterococcus_DN1.PRE.2